MVARKPNSAGIKTHHGVLFILLFLSLTSLGVLARTMVEEVTSQSERTAAFAGEVTGPSHPRPSAPTPEQGQTQEDRVRDALTKEGYEQPYGTTDAEIRAYLNIEGKTADIVGYHPAQDRWLIAESKGGDIEAAFRQLQNTLDKLVEMRPGLDASKIELRIYTNSRQFARLTQENIAGWHLEEHGYLGWKNEADQWLFAEVRGARIIVMPAP